MDEHVWDCTLTETEASTLEYVLIRVTDDPELRDHFYEVRDRDIVERLVFVTTAGDYSWDDRSAYAPDERPPSLVYDEWKKNMPAPEPGLEIVEITRETFEETFAQAREHGNRMDY